MVPGFRSFRSGFSVTMFRVCHSGFVIPGFLFRVSHGYPVVAAPPAPPANLDFNPSGGLQATDYAPRPSLGHPRL